jgi:hypothetical protein
MKTGFATRCTQGQLLAAVIKKLCEADRFADDVFQIFAMNQSGAE